MTHASALIGLDQGLFEDELDDTTGDLRPPGPVLGLGQLLALGRDLNQTELVITAIVLILLVGIAVDLLFFSPLSVASCATGASRSTVRASRLVPGGVRWPILARGCD